MPKTSTFRTEIRKTVAALRCDEQHELELTPRVAQNLRSMFSVEEDFADVKVRKKKGTAGVYVITRGCAAFQSVRSRVLSALHHLPQEAHIDCKGSERMAAGYVTEFNRESGTRYEWERTAQGLRVWRNVGMEGCGALVAALNKGDAEAIAQAYRKLGCLVRLRLLQMGMGVSVPLALDAEYKDPKDNKAK